MTTSLLLSVTVVSASGAVADDDAHAKKWLRPATCAEMELPSEDSLLDDLNHASIRLDSLPDGTKVTVDENGQISVSGVVHKHGTMVDVAVGKVSSTNFVLGPPPEGVANWAESWTASLRPPELGTNLMCTRAEREPGRYARILRSIVVEDLIPPSTVAAVTIGEVTSSTATVSWPAATDNYGLAGYDVSLDGGPAARVSVATESYTFTGLAPQTSHTISVTAVDLAGNTSAAPTTATFTTLAPPPPPVVDPKLTLDIGEGATDATWHPDDADAGYRVTVTSPIDGEISVDEFTRTDYCMNAGALADPCTADSTVIYPATGLEQNRAYTLTVEALDAANVSKRRFSADFRTNPVVPDVSAADAERAVSESMQCAGQGGDIYLNADLRGQVNVPAGATQLFEGCISVPDATCIDSFNDEDEALVLDCDDDVTGFMLAVAPAGGGPVLSALAPSAARTPVQLGSVCVATGCTITGAPPAAAQAVVAEAERIVARAESRLVLRGVLAAAGRVALASAARIGLSAAGAILMDIINAEQLAVAGLVEWPINYETDFRGYEDWYLMRGSYVPDLAIYGQIITTTKEVSSGQNLNFQWDEQDDSELKHMIARACAQQSGSGSGGCKDDTVVYFVGGKNYKNENMPETGKHIAETMDTSTWTQPDELARAQWFYPSRSAGGKAADAAGYKRNWYFNVANQPFVNCPKANKAGKVCDEFPYYSTTQAAKLSGVWASTRFVPSAEAMPQANDISGLYNKCKVADGAPFIVLPFEPWVDAQGPSFGLKVASNSVDVCMKPEAPTP